MTWDVICHILQPFGIVETGKTSFEQADTLLLLEENAADLPNVIYVTAESSLPLHFRRALVVSVGEIPPKSENYIHLKQSALAQVFNALASAKSRLDTLTATLSLCDSDQEAVDLAPAKALQPKSKTIRYDNMKSAMAEEGVLALILREPALLDRSKDLTQEAFSSQLLGRVYSQLLSRFHNGQEVSLAVLEDLSSEEMSHVTGILHRNQGPVNEQAFDDCIRRILAEHEANSVSSEEDLLAFQNKLKERKGLKA
jgi:DNA primase